MEMQTHRFSSGEEWVILEADDLNRSEAYGLEPEVLAYALDADETAHMDYDSHSQTRTFVYNILQADASGIYRSRPVIFILKPGYLITVRTAETAALLHRFGTYLRSQPSPISRESFLFSCFEQISKDFQPILYHLEKSRDQVNGLLRKKTTQKELYRLSDIELNLLYVAAASKHNSLLLERIKDGSFYLQLSEGEKERYTDASIEASQFQAMADLSLKVLESLADTYDRILNNNLNANLSMLNIIDILLAVMAVITGFFGMNVPLPFTSDQTVWVWIIVMSLGLWVLLAQWLKWMIRR